MANLKISETKRQEIIDHVYNTWNELIKCYDLRQLALIEWKDPKYIKSDPRFLPVRIDNAISRNKEKLWNKRTCYSVKYIRLDEIKHIFNKKTGRKLVVEYY